MRFGLEADDWLKDAEVIHQQHQGDKRHQWHQVGDNDVDHRLPFVCAIYPRGLKRVLWNSLKARVKGDKAEGERVPHPLNDQHNPHKWG